MAEERSIKDRVLVVVDDARLRGRLASILEREGYRCALAEDVGDARARLERAPYRPDRVRRGPSPGPIVGRRSQPRSDRARTLTPRQREVLQLAADGRSGREIADALVVSAGTVKTHFQNIYEKLGARDRASAVAMGLRRGLID